MGSNGWACHRSVVWTLFLAVVLGIALSPEGTAAEQAPSAEELLRASIAYHDPQDVWSRGVVDLKIHDVFSPALAEARGVSEVWVELTLSPAQQRFRYMKKEGEDLLEYSIEHGKSAVLLNGASDISPEDKDRLRIGDPGLYRDYFEYLYGMPMKLRDQGTHLGAVERAMFNGAEVWSLRVTYDPEVGDDIWYFYFNPETYAVTGYRFFHDEAKNDGEYIVLEGEVHDAASGFRRPQSLGWYYNADGGHLATEVIQDMRVVN